jgi:hypothetical protein
LKCRCVARSIPSDHVHSLAGYGKESAMSVIQVYQKEGPTIHLLREDKLCT